VLDAVKSMTRHGSASGYHIDGPVLGANHVKHQTTLLTQDMAVLEAIMFLSYWTAHHVCPGIYKEDVKAGEKHFEEVKNILRR